MNFKRTILRLVYSFFILAVTMFSLVAAEPYRILIVQSQSQSIYDQVISGSQDFFNGSGYANKIETEIKDLSKHKDAVANIWQSRPDLIFTIGTRVTKIVKNLASDIPIVFIMVFEPHNNQILDVAGEPTNTITGIVLEIPVEKHLNYIQKILPDKKRVGLLYNSQHSDKFITEMKSKMSGRDIEIVAINVSSTKMVPAALQQLENKIDAFWMITDPTIIEKNSRQQILLFWLKKNIPIIGIAPNYVKAGALYCLTPESYEMGRQAAEMGSRIIDGANPRDIQIQYPQAFTVTYNSEKASSLKVTIPSDVLKTAKDILK